MEPSSFFVSYIIMSIMIYDWNHNGFFEIIKILGRIMSFWMCIWAELSIFCKNIDPCVIAWNNFVMSGETILVFLRHAECCTFLLNYIEIGLDGHKAYCLVAFCELSKNIYFFLIKYLPKNTVTMNSSLFSNITFPKNFILFFLTNINHTFFLP